MEAIQKAGRTEYGSILKRSCQFELKESDLVTKRSLEHLFIHIQDQFNWNPDLPIDAFSPIIPEDFSEEQPNDNAK